MVMNRGIRQPTIKYATLNNSSWNVQTVVTNVHGNENLVLDSNGFPHFTYLMKGATNRTNDYVLYYASWNGTAWGSQVIPSDTNGDFSAGYLALDSHDNPHINYHLRGSDSSIGDLVYSEWNGTVWSSQTIDSHTTSAGPMVVDSDGNPHIIYRGQPVNVGDRVVPLMYATTSGFASTIGPTPTPPVGVPLMLLWLVVGVITVLIVAIYVFSKKQEKPTAFLNATYFDFSRK